VIAPNGMVVALDAGGRQLWQALEAGCTEDDLVDASVRHGNVSSDVARSNVARTLASWRALGLINPTAGKVDPAPLAPPVVARPHGRAPELDAVYLVGDRPVRVRCDDDVLASVIEAACRRCRVVPSEDGLATVDVIEQEGWFVVRADDAVLARADGRTSIPALARHWCLTALLESARRPGRWLGILHASAIAADGRCVVFPGAKGSGKSTLAAALIAAGAEFVTDDYAPLEQASRLVWPVPYAPGIKRGSWRALERYYPDLQERPVHELSGLHIRYLELDAARMVPLNRGLPVEALVFPRYKPGAPLKQRRITAAEALAGLCHTRSILDRDPDKLAETIRWVESVPAYRLIYGDLERAIEQILSLLGVK
jgi:Coenzyme PQQ synthesis protein D (PqqD)